LMYVHTSVPFRGIYMDPSTLKLAPNINLYFY
jgi:hypothetical protein